MRIEQRIWIAILIIMFAGVPFIRVDLSTIEYDRTRSLQCQVTAPLPAETGWNPVFTSLNNQSAQVPIWWFFLHAISKAVTGGAVASIPCGTDLRQMRIEINSTHINDPVLAQEVADFTRDCYGAARSKLFMSRRVWRNRSKAAKRTAWFWTHRRVLRCVQGDRGSAIHYAGRRSGWKGKRYLLQAEVFISGNQCREGDCE